MGFVGRGRTADGQADAVDRKRIMAADTRQVMVEGAARHHVVLGVDLEKSQRGQVLQDGLKMFGLQSKAAAGRQRTDPRNGSAARTLHAGDVLRHGGRSVSLSVAQAFFSLKAASWPCPVGEVGEAVFSQVPLGTRFQALPW